MKGTVLAKYLRPVTVALGLLALGLRRLLYGLAADEWGLLPALHPLEAAVWLVTAAALLLIAATVWGLDGSARYSHNFFPSPVAAAGHFLAAAAIGGTVALCAPPMEGGLGLMWRLTGIVAVGCMTAAGTARYQGRRPFFLLHLGLCAFLVIHIVSQYRGWSADPQFMDYVFSLFGQIGLMFFAYYTAAFDVGLGKRRMHLGVGLTAVFLNLAGLEWDGYALLRLACTGWVLSDLCTFIPRPKPPKAPQEHKSDDPA